MKKLIFFHASWCSPCKYMFKNVINRLNNKYPNQIEIVDVQNEPVEAEKRKVIRLPTCIIMNGSNEICRYEGIHDIEELEKYLYD